MDQFKKTEKLTELSLLNANPLFISDTSIRNGLKGFAIKAIEDSVIAAISYQSLPNSNTLVGETILGGDIWFLPNITSITLTSGAVIVYQIES